MSVIQDGPGTPATGPQLIDGISLTASSGSRYSAPAPPPLDWAYPPSLAGDMHAWVRIFNDELYLVFGIPSAYAPGEDFVTLTRDETRAYPLVENPTLIPTAHRVLAYADYVYVYRTPAGTYGKIKVRCTSWLNDWHDGVWSRQAIVAYEYVTFN